MSKTPDNYFDQRRNRALTITLWIVFAATLLFGLFNLDLAEWRSALAMFTASATSLFSIYLNAKKQPLPAALLLCTSVLITITYSIFDGDGLFDPGIMGYPLFVLLGTMLLDKRSTPWLLLSSLLSLAVVTYSQSNGLTHPTLQPDDVSMATPIMIFVAVASLIVWVIQDRQEQDLKQIRKTERQITEMLENTQRLNAELQWELAERTHHEQEMESIATLSEALRSASNRAEILPVIARQITNLVNADAVTVEMLEPLTGDVVIEVAEGLWKDLSGAHQKQGTGINAVISRTLQPYNTHDLQNDPNLTYPEWARNGIHGAAGVPLIAQEKLIGFTWIGRKTDLAEAEVRLLAAVGNIAANAIHRVTLHEQTLKNAVDLELAYNTTLEGWAKALELRDQETEGHSQRVVEQTVKLARLMGVNEDDLENIRRGALLHDIGKMGIPDTILLKAGKLNEQEWEIMRKHPTYAFNLLNRIEYLKPALDIPYCHHEKWDGSGYPRKLKGEEIPLPARLFAVVDVWDAVTNDRVYRRAWSTAESISYIRQQSGRHFDPQVVEVFLQTLNVRQSG